MANLFWMMDKARSMQSLNLLMTDCTASAKQKVTMKQSLSMEI